MDWWRLFSGTFVLIFLAELGDKTQLAALAKTADAPDGSWAKWIVFLGASLALVVSTFVAVFLGHILKRVVPDERYIRLAAGALFLVFGFMILYEVISSYRSEGGSAVAESAATADYSSESGLMGGIALRAAMDFEAMSMERYQRVAAESSPELAELLLQIAREEEDHLRRLRGLPDEAIRDEVWKCDLPTRSSVSGRGMPAGDQRVMERLISHEEASASFYADLAARTLIPSVRTVLTRLADEEQSHAARLRGHLG
ncbi:MAG: TMEM165/GDT1 family protein [Planctomycetaceae bacterium]|nr:TMEM165/GDT1 family protein [Planctomycetaceae bacterium]